MLDKASHAFRVESFRVMLGANVPSQTEQPETWKLVPGFPDYEVSDIGRLRSWRGVRGPRRKSPLLLKPWPSRGYLQAMLFRQDGERVHVLVHFAVAWAFLGPCPAGHEVNHKDTVRSNCRLSNLEYLTRSENILHAYRVGAKTATGSNNGFAKLDENGALRIVELSGEGNSQRAIARLVGIHQSTVSDVLTGRSWSHATGRVYRA